MSKKVLIITYYWPPSGGGGVQRWLKFAKYLPEYDWQPIIYTPDNPDFNLKDVSLNKDVREDQVVIRYPIWEPFAIYRKLVGSSSDSDLKQGVVIEKSKMSLMNRIAIWVRANLLIPDPRRFWIKPSIKFLTHYIQEQNIDLVVTTGPPHSMHMIGYGLKKATNVKWVADFRDPWSDWDILDKLGVKGWTRRRHIKLESKVLTTADHILTVSNRMQNMFAEKDLNSSISVVTNGFDSEEEIVPVQETNRKFVISHFGLINEMRNPKKLWSVLEELCSESDEFANKIEIRLAGMVSQSILEELNASSLKSKVNYELYVPHNKINALHTESSLLLLLMNDSQNADLLIPGKLFESMKSNRDILALGSKNTDVNQILMASGGSEVLCYDDKQGIKNRVSMAFEQYHKGESHVEYNNIDRFHRKNLTAELSLLFNRIQSEVSCTIN